MGLKERRKTEKKRDQSSDLVKEETEMSISDKGCKQQKITEDIAKCRQQARDDTRRAVIVNKLCEERMVLSVCHIICCLSDPK